MADISVISRLAGGTQKNINIANNTLVTTSVKVGGPTTNTELTKTILDKLILINTAADADGTFDSRYHTKTALAAADAVSLIGDGNSYSNFSGGSTLKSTLANIDTALGTAGQTSFDEADFKIYKTSTAFWVKFDLNALTFERTITMPNTNVDLGDIAINTTNINTNTSNITANTTAISDLHSLTGAGGNAQHLGIFDGNIISENSTIRSALQSLETYAESTRSIINNFEWQHAVKARLATPPATPATGDRYLVIATATGDWAGKQNQIAEWDGSEWVFTVCIAGTYVSVDDEDNGLYLFGGSTWEKKFFESTTASGLLYKDGFDIRMATGTAANIIVYNGSGVASAVAMTGDVTISSTGVTAIGSGKITDAMLVSTFIKTTEVDNSSIEWSGTALQVKALGITNAMLAGSIETTKLADSAAIGEAVTFFTSTNISAAEAETLTDGSNADALHTHDISALKSDGVAGEAFAAGVYMVRYGVTDLDTPETASRLYKADPTQSSLVKTGSNKDPFWVVGIINPASALSAGDAIPTVVKKGLMTVTDHGLNVGEPFFLSDSGTLVSNGSEPTAEGEAVVRGGIVKDANTLDVDIVVVGVN